MENSILLEKIQNITESYFLKEEETKVFFIGAGILSIPAMYLMYIFIFYPSSDYIGMGILVFLFILPFLYFLIKFIIGYHMRCYYLRIKSIYTLWQDQKIKNSTIEEIYELIIKVQKSMQKLDTDGLDKRQIQLSELTYEFLINILKEVKNELHKRIEEKKGILIKGKGTLANIANIKHVAIVGAEIQDFRLQEQVKQFEELEKILVRW